MPAEGQGGGGRERLEFDRIQNDTGEDPARWLDWQFIRHQERRNIALSLIDSIDTIERIRAWKAVERALAQEHDREPRSKIMQRLDQREEWLQLHGERPDRLEHRDADRDLPPVETSFPDRDDVDEPSDRSTFSAEPAFGPLEERYPHLFGDGDDAAESAETGAVATDGGGGE